MPENINESYNKMQLTGFAKGILTNLLQSLYLILEVFCFFSQLFAPERLQIWFSILVRVEGPVGPKIKHNDFGISASEKHV